MRLHQYAILSGDAHRNMAEDIVPMPLVSENVAGISEFFFEIS
jgi:hypothetical protein